MRVVEGRAFFRGGFEECCIGIENGKIVEIKKILKGDEHHRFGNNYILPASVDIHVHFREPGQTHKEDFHSGTESAACSGVSCVFDMPNNVPPVIDTRTYEEKLSAIEGKANVDYGVYVALNENSRPEELSALGCPFKVYMVESAKGLGFLNYGKLGGVIQDLGTHRHIAVHCEDKELVREGGRDLEDFLKMRPHEAETSAIQRIVQIAGKTKVHICHVSAKDSIPLLDSTNLTSEATPHHLLLNKGQDLEAFGKTNPPLRTKSDQIAMWEALSSGKIDIVASDHAPHTIEEKEESFEYAPSGVPGVGTSLPLMLAHVKKGILTIERLVSSMMERPAEIMGVEKGRIEVGMDAPDSP